MHSEKISFSIGGETGAAIVGLVKSASMFFKAQVEKHFSPMKVMKYWDQEEMEELHEEVLVLRLLAEKEELQVRITQASILLKQLEASEKTKSLKKSAPRKKTDILKQGTKPVATAQARGEGGRFVGNVEPATQDRDEARTSP